MLDLFKRELPKLHYYSILEMIEVFMLRRHVCEYRTGELDDIFSSLVKISNENIVEDVREKLKKHLPTDVEFETKFKTHSYKSNGPRAKYVLEVFEYKLIEDQGEYTLNKGRELQLEHIIPQKIHTKKSKRKYGDWETYLGENSLDIFTEYIYRIGNLTLLGEKLNIVASNNPYHAKLVEYKKSNIRLTQNLVENYSEFKFDAVEKRSDDFAKMAPKIWSL